MKHYICETHLPKSGPLHRYIGIDANTKREAYNLLKKQLKKDEYIPTQTIKTVNVERMAKYR